MDDSTNTAADRATVDNIVVNKAAIIERCYARIVEVYDDDPRNLREDLTKQDSIMLNLQRACEASIDLAMHLARRYRLGVPQDSRGAFELLADADLLSADRAAALGAMVGFRNIAVRDYRKVSLDIVEAIIERHLREDLLWWAQEALRRFS